MILVIAAALPLMVHGAFTTLSDAIPRLSNLTLLSPSRYPPNLGGMNMTHCCLLAVNSSFDISDGNLIVSNTSFLSPGTIPSDFLSAASQDQFSCTASYNYDPSGAPPIQARYPWCRAQCRGWQMSRLKKLQQWISPMTSFILPSLIFCLNIPRRRILEVSDRLFQPERGSRWTFLLASIRFVVDAVTVSIDTLMWLALCFAFAAPMILSGVYEAF
jgi:hypothetical protein